MNDPDFQSLLRQSGWCILPAIIPTREVNHLKSEIVALVKNLNPGNAVEKAEAKLLGLSGVINYSQSVVKYILDKGMITLVEALLGSSARISSIVAIITRPGNGRGGWHADWPFDQKCLGAIRAPYPPMMAQLTTVWMLSPFTQENGGTLILPNTHTFGSNPTADIRSEEPHV